MTEQQVVRRNAQRDDRGRQSGQVEIDFGPDGRPGDLQSEREHQLQKADAKMLALLADGPVSYELLQPRVLELPLVWNTDLNDILVLGDQSGRFVIKGRASRQRVHRVGCTIRLGPHDGPRADGAMRGLQATASEPWRRLGS